MGKNLVLWFTLQSQSMRAQRTTRYKTNSHLNNTEPGFFI